MIIKFKPAAFAVIANLASINMASATEVERIIITATHTKHSELSAPASVSIITAEDIEKLSVNNLADALKATMSIDILPTASYGRSDVSIRGMDSDYTLVLINGRRINSHAALIRGNDFDLGSVPMSAVKRIEIVRGPMSSLYGSEALGGVVNVILKEAGEQIAGSITLNHESILTGTGGAQNKVSGYVSGKINEQVSMLLMAETVQRADWQTDDFPDIDGLEERKANQILAELDWRVAKNQNVSFDMLFSNDEREADWARRKFFVTNNQKTDRSNISIAHEGNWQHFDSEIRLYQDRTDINDASTAYKTADVTQTNTIADAKFSTNIANVDVVTGAEYRKTKLINDRDLVSGHAEDNQTALFVQVEVDFDVVTFTLGNRLDNHSVFGTESSPRAYAVAEVTDGFAIKAGVGQAFKAPNLTEMSKEFQVISCGSVCWLRGNAELVPETSTSKELGFVYQQDNFGLSLMTYHNDIKNKIERDLTTTAVDMVAGVPVITYQNVGSAEVKGTEASAWLDVNDLSIDISFTKTDAIDKDTGTRLSGVPDKNAKISISWKVGANINVFSQANYIGSQLMRSGLAGSYSTINLGASYQFNEQLKLVVGANNIANREFGDELATYGYALKGRSLYANLGYHF